MKKKLTKTELKRRINLFNKSCRYFHEYFGLFHWELLVDCQSADDCMGCVSWDIPGRVARVTLSNEWVNTEDATDIEIIKTAFHELLELYMAQIHESLSKLKDHAFASEQVHTVIRLMENKLFPHIDIGKIGK